MVRDGAHRDEALRRRVIDRFLQQPRLADAMTARNDPTVAGPANGGRKSTSHGREFNFATDHREIGPRGVGHASKVRRYGSLR
jgi:hypothetical protein